jgi:Tol biopolymer transport system component
MNPVWSPDGQFLVYAGVEVGTRFSFKAATADGKPHRTPEITVPTENLIRDIRALKR